MDSRKLAATIFDTPTRQFAVELWDGTVLPCMTRPPRTRLVLRTESAVAHLIPPISEEGLASAFINGDVDLTGDTIEAMENLARWDGPQRILAHLPAFVAVQAGKLRSRLSVPPRRFRGRAHSIIRDGDVVRSHYDAPLALFKLFLDDSMTYSCAYFVSDDDSLEAAQRNKLELIARKLGLRKGDTFLDVGCGWGSLLALATTRDADAFGVTVSESQYLHAKRGGMHVERRDYRHLPETSFDKIASVGMMEHVGRKRLSEYFRAIFSHLRPGGLFLNHAIADATPGVPVVAWARHRHRGFIERDVFPDSELLPIGEVVRVAESVGFEVRDVESLREHYALTLRRWLERLETHAAQAERLVGREGTRQWRLYLASCAVAFRLGKISVYQLLLARRDENGEVCNAARERARWHVDHVHA